MWRGKGEIMNLNGHEIPVNKLAALLIGKRNPKPDIDFVKNKNGTTTYMIQPLIEDYPYGKESDLTGTRYHRLTVIGFAPGSRRSAGGSLWVVKCDCGNFEYRRSKKINAAVKSISSGEYNESIHRCFLCDQIARSREKYFNSKMGYYPRTDCVY